jgi:hypothetical protein
MENWKKTPNPQYYARRWIIILKINVFVISYNNNNNNVFLCSSEQWDEIMRSW